MLLIGMKNLTNAQLPYDIRSQCSIRDNRDILKLVLRVDAKKYDDIFLHGEFGNIELLPEVEEKTTFFQDEETLKHLLNCKVDGIVPVHNSKSVRAGFLPVGGSDNPEDLNHCPWVYDDEPVIVDNPPDLTKPSPSKNSGVPVPNSLVQSELTDTVEDDIDLSTFFDPSAVQDRVNNVIPEDAIDMSDILSAFEETERKIQEEEGRKEQEVDRKLKEKEDRDRKKEGKQNEADKVLNNRKPKHNWFVEMSISAYKSLLAIILTILDPVFEVLKVVFFSVVMTTCLAAAVLIVSGKPANTHTALDIYTNFKVLALQLISDYKTYSATK